MMEKIKIDISIKIKSPFYLAAKASIGSPYFCISYHLKGTHTTSNKTVVGKCNVDGCLRGETFK